MKNIKNVIIGMIVVVGVILLVFSLSKLSENSYYKKINEKEYKEVIKKDAIVYIGEDTNKIELLKEAAKENNFKIYLISKVDKKDTNVIEIWKNKKLASSYDFSDFKSSEEKDREKTKVSIDKYVEQVKAEGYNFMYVGRTGCGYCQQYETSVKDLLNTYDINVYYLDTDDLDEAGYEKLLASDSYFESGNWGTPTTMLYKDGVRIDMLSGYVASDELLKFIEKNYIKQALIDLKVIK